MLCQFQARMVHQRGYNDNYDTYSFNIHETNMALMNAKNTDQIAYIFKKYGAHLTDVQMAYGFWAVGANQLGKSEEFWSVIYPAVKKQIATLDRNCVRSLL